jgi:hypothetical protein
VIFAAIRRVSSLVSTFAADRRCAYPLVYATQQERPPNTLSFAYLNGDNYYGSRGTVRVPMLVRILRTYRLPEILMLAAATLCVVVSEIYTPW